MIVVRVELWSAIDGERTELARMLIANEGGTAHRGDYDVKVLRGRSAGQLDRGTVQKVAKVRDYPRLAVHVWNLVARALAATGYSA